MDDSSSEVRTALGEGKLVTLTALSLRDPC